MSNNSSIANNFLDQLYTNLPFGERELDSSALGNRIKKDKIKLLRRILTIVIVLIGVQIIASAFLGRYDIAIFNIVINIVLLFMNWLLDKDKLQVVLWMILVVFYPMIAFTPFFVGLYYSNLATIIAIWAILNYISNKQNFKLLNSVSATIAGIISMLLIVWGNFEKGLFMVDIAAFVNSAMVIYYTFQCNQKEITDYQNELVKSNSFFKMIIDNNPHHIFVKDKDFRYVFVNEAIAKFNGLKKEDMLGKKSQDLSNFSSRGSTIQQQDSEVILTKEPLYSQELFEKYNKEARYIQATKIPMLGSTKSVEGILGIGADITERVQASIALKRNELKYRSMFEQNSLGVVVVKDSIFVDTNQGFCEMTAYSREEIIGMRVDNIINKEDYLKHYDSLEAAIRTNEVSEGFEHRIIRKDASIGYVLVHIMGLKKDGIIESAVATIADISQVKESEIALKNKNEELAKYIESNMALESFAYLTSHDLKEPIRSIVSFSQLLKDSMLNRLEGEEKTYLEFIVGSAKNMEALIDDLLAYSKVNGKEAELKEFDLRALLRSIELDLSDQIEREEAQIIYENIPEKIVGDKTQIRQLFQNLISNGIKFRRPTENPILTISAKAQNNTYLFEVSDNGIGINPQYYDRIFLLFKKLHNKREYEGTGIGLSICKKVIENHGGNIALSSEVGKGTTFSFTLEKRMEGLN